MSQLAELNLSLHPRQGEALTSLANEILYGGAAGGGKSHLLRVASILWCSAIPGLQVYLFRRIRDDLVKNHMEGPKGYRAMLAGWAISGFVQIVEDEIRFWNGSKIYLCHCKDEKDVYKYQGAEIHVLLIDELTHFTESMYRFLRNRVRMVGITLLEQYRGTFPRILCGANPGNIGHLWVKATFVDGALPMELRRRPANDGGMLRQMIPAKLDDNPSMAEDDPGYEGRLEGLGSEALVRAMRHGDWDIIEGAFFDCWNDWKLKGGIIRPCLFPEHWLRFRSGDWGSARPFSFGWWVVASEDFIHPDGQIIPKGAMIRYREWYGAQSPNVGLKLHAEVVGRGVAEREGAKFDAFGKMLSAPTERITYGVLDPAAFSEDGGPSIAERMSQGAANKIFFGRADNARVSQRGAMGGWDQLRARFLGEDDRPMIYCFSTCGESIRTIPALQHDKDRIEDLDSDGEDHAADEWCYASMSRPYIRPDGKKPPSKFEYESRPDGMIVGNVSIRELIERQARRRGEE